MKKNYCIGWLLIGAAAMFLITHSVASAADKVVVIPLGSSKDTGAVPTVTSGGGLVWMDRNLGALRVATKSDDSQAYGSLYQWGRLGDGHEYRESLATSNRSPDNVPGHGHFITVNDSPPDWRTTPNNLLWEGESGVNNPCPAGFRLPTAPEWEIERYFWGSNNASGAFASPLKLVVAGSRYYNATLLGVGSRGSYWSSSAVGSYEADLLYFYSSGNAGVGDNARIYGHSIRCIKD